MMAGLLWADATEFTLATNRWTSAWACHVRCSSTSGMLASRFMTLLRALDGNCQKVLSCWTCRRRADGVTAVDWKSPDFWPKPQEPKKSWYSAITVVDTSSTDKPLQNRVP